MKILSVVGARPQFVKLGPVARALQDVHEHVIVHTGQHYDQNMSDNFFRDLGIPAPDAHLNVGSGSHGVQTGAILSRMDDVIQEHSPDWVMVYGDTNSTIAGALSAVKLHVPLAHLEAGLRSFNRRMPEEHNRVLTDHAADLCLAPTPLAAKNLLKEGLGQRTIVVGDVMTDVLLETAQNTPSAPLSDSSYVLATIHRAENTDDPQRLAHIISQLWDFPEQVLLPAHPRLVFKAAEQGLELNRGALKTVAPLDYPQMVSAVRSAQAVVTDSGGLQKEAFLLRTPCTTVRDETEWRETVDLGWNVLCSDLDQIAALAHRQLPPSTDASPYGTGHAAAATVRALEEAHPTRATGVCH